MPAWLHFANVTATRAHSLGVVACLIGCSRFSEHSARMDQRAGRMHTGRMSGVSLPSALLEGGKEDGEDLEIQLVSLFDG